MNVIRDLPADLFAIPPALRILRIDDQPRYVTMMAKRHGVQPDSRRDQIAENFAMNYVLRGAGTYIEAGGCAHPLAPGTLFQRLPGCRHSTLIDPGSDYAELFIVLDPATAQQLLALGLLAPSEVMQPGWGMGVIDAFGALQRDLARPESELPSPLALARVVTFLSGLYEQAGRAEAGDPWERIIRQACALLERDPGGRLDVADVAAELGVAYPTFRRRFRAATQLSPGAYRIRCRLERARYLLLQTSVTDVAAELGYSDPFAFSAQFKQRFGISPRGFQQQRMP